MTEGNTELMVIMPCLFILYAWIAWLIVEWSRLKRKSRLQQHLIDKFGSPLELQEFLQTDGGQKFLNFLKIGGPAARERILSSISICTILGCLGIGIFLLSLIFPDQAKVFQASAIVMITLAVGLLASALISNKLGRKWGLFDK
jgi:hypothetical protein